VKWESAGCHLRGILHDASTLPSQRAIRQMVTQSDGHIVQRHDQLEE
jgi:hypothetical protein